jgi:hypothetical protein
MPSLSPSVWSGLESTSQLSLQSGMPSKSESTSDTPHPQLPGDCLVPSVGHRSVLLATKPAGCVHACVLTAGSPKPSMSASAYHVRSGEIVNVVPIDTVLAHGAIGLEVHVSVTLPAESSARLGAYVVDCDETLPNVPVPLVDQEPPEEFDELAAMDTGPSPSHVV